jgi:hypothetical protein
VKTRVEAANALLNAYDTRQPFAGLGTVTASFAATRGGTEGGND